MAKAGLRGALLRAGSRHRVHRARPPHGPGLSGSSSWWPTLWTFRSWRPFRLDPLFRRLQLVSAGLYSLGHGGNDAQKTMGIITGLLVSGGLSRAEFDVPLWVILISHAAIALGTMLGGWRIVKTMGSRSPSCSPSAASAPRPRAPSCSSGTAVGGIPVSHDAHDHRRHHGRGGHAGASRP